MDHLLTSRLLVTKYRQSTGYLYEVHMGFQSEGVGLETPMSVEVSYVHGGSHFDMGEVQLGKLDLSRHGEKQGCAF